MLDEKRCCLVIIDLQGKLAELMHEKQQLFANIEILIKTANVLEFPILWCEQNPAALGETIPQIAQLLEENKPVEKMSFSCMGNEKFIHALKSAGSKQVILCGIEAHVCVYQTAVDLLDKDYEVCVIADAVSSRTRRNRHIAVQRMQAEGADISSTEMAVFELLRTAKHEKFKQLAKLIK